MRDPATYGSEPTTALDERLVTGLAEIDAQHAELFAIASELCAQCQAGASMPELLVELSYLRQYAVVNFDTEQEMIRAEGLDGAHQAAHSKAHADFLRHVDRIARLLVTRVDMNVGRLLDFLQKWLELHVSGLDCVMARQIRAKRSGADITHDSPVEGATEQALTEAIESLYAALGERTIEVLDLNLQLQEEISRRKKAEQDFSLSQMWIRTMADNAHSWEYWQGPDKEIIYMSPSCEQITGYTAADFTENPSLLYTIIHPEDRHLMDIRLHYIAQHQEDESELDMRIIRRDGDIRWIAHSCKPVNGRQGQSMGRRVSRRDRTERYRQEASLRMAATVFDVVNEAVLVTSRDNRILAVNPSFSTITGCAAEEVIGRDPRILSDGANPELEKDLWRTLVRTGRWQGELVYRHKSGSLYVCSVSINSVRDDTGHVTSFVSVFSDITERKENERRIYHLAHYDSTTGLPNRALFSDRLRQSVLAAKRYQAGLVLMFIDLDKFKPVNDRFGHDVGDMLLREIAERISECIRESDTAARIGGDEFVVLLPGVENESAVVNVAAKILQEIEQPFLYEGHEIRVSASIGFALYPEHGEDAQQLMKHADHAMYQAKRGNAGAIVSYTELARSGAAGTL